MNLLSRIKANTISKLSLHQSLVKRKFITKRHRRAREPSRISLRFLRRLKNKSSMLKKIVFKRISSILILKSSKLHRYVKKVRNCLVTVPKKNSLLPFSSRLYHVIMKLSVKHVDIHHCFLVTVKVMTNYLNFNLSTDVDKAILTY